ncbi:MAG: NAD-dependent epimerase/dehydratase family protein [Betaproteobacteria bacterium]
MKIAVTGASGFIGRYVLAELVRQRVDIVAVTRDARNLDQWKNQVDVLELDHGSALPSQLDCLAQTDTLIHLAWNGLPNYKSRHHFETELPRQYGFLKSLVERGLPAMLITGTCAEYGMQSGELSEGLPALPCNAYGFAKDSLRRQLEFLARDSATAMTWARLFYTYGDGQPATSLYTQLNAAMSRGDTVFDMSGGEQLRDFLPVEEVARLIVSLAMNRDNSGVVNLCSGKPISVRRLVEGWLADQASTIRLNLGKYPYPDYEPMAFWGSRDKLERILS